MQQWCEEACGTSKEKYRLIEHFSNYLNLLSLALIQEFKKNARCTVTLTEKEADFMSFQIIIIVIIIIIIIIIDLFSFLLQR